MPALSTGYSFVSGFSAAQAIVLGLEYRLQFPFGSNVRTASFNHKAPSSVRCRTSDGQPLGRVQVSMGLGGDLYVKRWTALPDA